MWTVFWQSKKTSNGNCPTNGSIKKKKKKRFAIIALSLLFLFISSLVSGAMIVPIMILYQIPCSCKQISMFIRYKWLLFLWPHHVAYLLFLQSINSQDIFSVTPKSKINYFHMIDSTIEGKKVKKNMNILIMVIIDLYIFMQYVTKKIFICNANRVLYFNGMQHLDLFD